MRKSDFGLMALIAIVIFVIATTAACSVDCSKTSCDKQAATTPTSTDTGSDQPFDLKGSVTSAFAVTVDGTKYDDMEAYYTATVNTLDSKVQALGYTGYTAEFDAQIGYSDLANGMTVYVTPATDRGYQGKTTVQDDGTFDLTMPPDAAGDTYQVKATKRVNLTLTKGTDVKKFCFNFSAVDLSVPYSDKDKPIVLNTFQSTITAYACAVDPTLEGSLPIPVATPTPVPTATSTATSTASQATLDATLQATAAEVSGHGN